MKVRHFLKKLEHARLEKAIHEAEHGTLGDIVVYLSHHCVEEAYPEAELIFQKLLLSNRTDQVSLLFFIAPGSRKFAVIGSPRLHEKVGDSFWQELVSILTPHFKEERYTDGLLTAIAAVGAKFRQYFPGQPNEPRGEDVIES